MASQGRASMNPPWGSDFPFRCGVTPDDFMFWYTYVVPGTNCRAPDRAVMTDHHGRPLQTAQVIDQFCQDCSGSFRHSALRRRVCRLVPA